MTNSPSIDKWIQEAPESWAKLAKKSKRKLSFEQFKKKFFEGAEADNKGYLKKYLTNEQLKHIYEKGAGGTERTGGGDVINKPIKPTKISVTRKGKTYSRTTNPRWGIQSKLVLTLAAKEKPRTKEYYKYLDLLIAQGRTRQASIKKIQRTRKEGLQ